jgi:hypothetical protein
MSVEPLELSSDEDDQDELMLELAQALNDLPEHLLLDDSAGETNQPSDTLAGTFQLQAGQPSSAYGRSPFPDHSAISAASSTRNSSLIDDDAHSVPYLINRAALIASNQGGNPSSTSHDRDEAEFAFTPSDSTQTASNYPKHSDTAIASPSTDFSRQLAAIVTSSSPHTPRSLPDDEVHLTPSQLHILYRAECRKTGQLQELLEEQRAAYQSQLADVSGQLADMQAGSQELVEEITVMTSELRTCQLQLQDKATELDTLRSELRETQHARGLAEAGETAVRDEFRRLEETVRTQTWSRGDESQSTQLQQQLTTMRQQHEAMVASLRQQLAQQQQHALAQQQQSQQQMVRLERQLRMTPVSTGRSTLEPAQEDWSSIDELLALSVYSLGDGEVDPTAVDNSDSRQQVSMPRRIPGVIPLAPSLPAHVTSPHIHGCILSRLHPAPALALASALSLARDPLATPGVSTGDWGSRDGR